jgi:hypothetical protein
MSTSPALAFVDPARMLDAFEARCRTETRALYALGDEREVQLATSGQADSVPSNETLTYFHSRVLPGASLRSLAASIVRAGVAVDVTTVAIASVLMMRYVESQAQPVSAHMMHRLFVACTLAAAKAHQDKFPCNKLLGKAVGISLSEMNRLECALTTALDWKFIVTQKDLLDTMSVLVPSKAVTVADASSDSYLANCSRDSATGYSTASQSSQNMSTHVDSDDGECAGR